MSDLLAQMGIKNREGVEAFVQSLIDLLDEIDGDADFEDTNDAEPEETDQNGDEGDYGMCEDDALAEQLYCLAFAPLEGGQGL